MSSGEAKSIDGLRCARHPPGCSLRDRGGEQIDKGDDEEGEKDERDEENLAGVSVTPVIAEENLNAMSLSSCDKSSS